LLLVCFGTLVPTFVSVVKNVPWLGFLRDAKMCIVTSMESLFEVFVLFRELLIVTRIYGSLMIGEPEIGSGGGWTIRSTVYQSWPIQNALREWSHDHRWNALGWKMPHYLLSVCTCDVRSVSNLVLVVLNTYCCLDYMIFSIWTPLNQSTATKVTITAFTELSVQPG
jgi:hypothetical protein